MGLHSEEVQDVATVSNFREVIVQHYNLDLTVDFQTRVIDSKVTITFICKQPTKNVKLDVHETMTVESVKCGDESLKHEVKPFTGYGSELTIQLNSEVSAEQKFDLMIQYKATGGPGVCWLDPQQTAGKKKPYMYTQGQAVMNRSFFPCQDTPAIKSTYNATVRVAEGFTAVMSANSNVKSPDLVDINGLKHQTYDFGLDVPIPSYLVALAVGDLKSAKVGPRSRIWTEPCMLEACKSELDGIVEDFISTGERLFGDYVWGNYDVLVMPPSFPFGGMENPCLTFVTPCIIVGDKSLTDVIIHEISHSWFGNLVTNANWSEFWLNEGFTMFAQRRITEELFGKPYACLEASTGQALLRQHIDNEGQDHPLTKLRVVIEPGVDPDDTYNETPYEKGFAFVSYLQHVVGDVKKFDDFLKSYVSKYKYKSLVAEDMFDYFLEYFPNLKDNNIDKKEGFEFTDTWLHKPGWPPYTPDLSDGKELTGPVEDLAKQWREGGGEKIADVDIGQWKTYQILHFLDQLLEGTDLSHDTMETLAKTYPKISQTTNAEIRLRWSLLTIKHDYVADFDNVKNFLRSQGKQKYTLPVYRQLVKGSETAKKLAQDMYKETKEMLHVGVQAYVKDILDKANL